jgi:hypothetical protein
MDSFARWMIWALLPALPPANKIYPTTRGYQPPAWFVDVIDIIPSVNRSFNAFQRRPSRFNRLLTNASGYRTENIIKVRIPGGLSIPPFLFAGQRGFPRSESP